MMREEGEGEGFISPGKSFLFIAFHFTPTFSTNDQNREEPRFKTRPQESEINRVNRRGDRFKQDFQTRLPSLQTPCPFLSKRDGERGEDNWQANFFIKHTIFQERLIKSRLRSQTRFLICRSAYPGFRSSMLQRVSRASTPASNLTVTSNHDKQRGKVDPRLKILIKKKEAVGPRVQLAECGVFSND